MDLGIQDHVYGKSYGMSPSDIAEIVVDQNIMMAQEELDRSRFYSMVNGLREFDPDEREIIIDYLRQDPTIDSIVGDNPDNYYDNLKSYARDLKESNEGFVTGFLVTLAVIGVGKLLAHLRDTMFMLRKSLTKGEIPDDEWLNNHSSSRLVLCYKSFKENDATLNNAYKSIKSLLGKKDPSEADFGSVAMSLGIDIKKVSERSAGKYIKGGIIGVLAGAGVSILSYLVVNGILGAIAGPLIVAGKLGGVGMKILGGAHIAGALASRIAGWFVTWRVGHNVSNATASSYASKGWTSKTVAEARDRCLAHIKNMDDIASTAKSGGEMDRTKAKAIKRVIELYGHAVQGMCISTSRMLD